MGFCNDLLMPFGARGIRLVAPDTVAIGQHRQLYVRIVRVLPARPVAGLAREALVFMLAELLKFVGMTFFARFFACKNRFTRPQLHQRVAAIPAILFEGRRSQEVASDAVGADDADRKEENAENLGRHLKKWAHSLIQLLFCFAAFVFVFNLLAKNVSSPLLNALPPLSNDCRFLPSNRP